MRPCNREVTNTTRSDNVCSEMVASIDYGGGLGVEHAATIVSGTFASALFNLLLAKKEIGPLNSPYYVIVFGIGCGAMAFLFALLDLFYFHLRGSTFLGLQYGGWKTSIGFIVWAGAAAIVGMLALSLDVLKPTIAGCIGAGVSWRVILAVLIGQYETPSTGTDEDD
jgi:hypothetical protein